MKSAIYLLYLLLLCVPPLSYTQTTAELTLQLSHADGCTRLGPGVTASAVDTLRGRIYTGSVDTVYGIVQFQDLSTPVHEQDPEKLSFSLGTAYPNPAKGVVRYPLRVDKSGDVTVEFFNNIGQLVAEKTYNNVQAGEYSIVFDTGDLSTGMYLYRARKNGEATESGKTLVLPGSEGFNLAKFSQSLEPADYSDREWHSSKPALRKGLLKQGVEYNIEIDGDYLEKLSFNVTVDKDTTIERVVQGILEGYLQNASFDEDGEDTQQLDFSSPWGKVGYEALNTNDSLLVEIVDGTRMKVRGANDDVNGSYADTLAVVGPHGRRMKKGFNVTISAMDDLRGKVTDHQSEVGRTGILTVDGREYVVNADGSFDVQVEPGYSHELKARQYKDEKPYSFIRTVDVPGEKDNNNLTVKVVDYSGLSLDDTSKVTPEKFRKFAREVNFDEQLNCEYDGLKKFDYDSLVVWVAYDNNWTDDTFTVEQQERVRDRFIDEILPNFLGRGVKEVYMEDRNNPEENPYYSGARNIALQRPNNSIPGDGEAGVSDWDNDGILDLGGASYRVTAANMPNTSVIDEEGATSIGAIGIPSVLDATQTKFAVGGAGHFTIYDKKFGHILGEATYLPKESVHRILGL